MQVSFWAHVNISYHIQLHFTTNVVAKKTYIIKQNLNKLNKWSLNYSYIDTLVRRIRTQFQFLFCKLSTEFAQYILWWHYVRKKLAFVLSYGIVRSLNIKHFHTVISNLFRSSKYRVVSYSIIHYANNDRNDGKSRIRGLTWRMVVSQVLRLGNCENVVSKWEELSQWKRA